MKTPRQSLLLLAITSGIALPACMPGSPALIDVQLTVTTEPGTPAVRLPPTTVPSGETATFPVAGRELHITPSLKHGLVMIQVWIGEPIGDGLAEQATEPLVMTTAAGAGRIVTLRVDTTTIAIEATRSRLLSLHDEASPAAHAREARPDFTETARP